MHRNKDLERSASIHIYKGVVSMCLYVLTLDISGVWGILQIIRASKIGTEKKTEPKLKNLGIS